eukprot:jgi/Mesvir1/5429/Mv15489-RA.1
MDVKDILGLPRDAAPAPARPKPAPSMKKPEGISREVFALTGGIPPVVPSVDVIAGLKEKRRTGSQARKVSWEWKPFQSSARKDGLQLCHWVRSVVGQEPTSTDHAFAKYNKSVEVPRYSDEEYAKHLTDGPWTREETDHLLDLCVRFDLRFTVITDRFEIVPPGSNEPRTMEELKARYYEVVSKLLEARASCREDILHEPAIKDPFNITHETERKVALHALWTRTKQQEKEEMEVIAAAKAIEEARKQRAVTGTGTLADAHLGLARKKGVKGGAEQLQGCIPMSAISRQTPGVFLRGIKLTTAISQSNSGLGGKIGRRLEAMMQDELKVSPHVTCPTKLVCVEYIRLRAEALQLHQLQKQVARKEYEVSMLRQNPHAEIPPMPMPKLAARAQKVPPATPASVPEERVSTRATAITPSTPEAITPPLFPETAAAAAPTPDASTDALAASLKKRGEKRKDRPGVIWRILPLNVCVTRQRLLPCDARAHVGGRTWVVTVKVARTSTDICMAHDMATSALCYHVRLGDMASRHPMVEQLGMMALFVAFCAFLSRTAVPPLFRFISKLSIASVELYQLAALSFCLAVAMLSDLMGLSIELGCFVAGVMVSSTEYSERTLHQVEPIRNIFASLFLVSIGMIMNPLFLWEHLDILLASVVLAATAKTALITLVVKAFGYSMRTSLSVGLAMAQIGEFAFVLLSRASNMGLVQKKLYLLLLGTTALSLVSIFLSSSRNFSLFACIAGYNMLLVLTPLVFYLMPHIVRVVHTPTYPKAQILKCPSLALAAFFYFMLHIFPDGVILKWIKAKEDDGPLLPEVEANGNANDSHSHKR